MSEPIRLLPVVECCAPVLADPLTQGEAEDLAGAFRVLADPARLRLLGLIAASPGGEACACDLIEPLGLSQPTVSHHLKVLTEAGLLERERRGTWVYHRIVRAPFDALRDALSPKGIRSPRAPSRSSSRSSPPARRGTRAAVPSVPG